MEPSLPFRGPFGSFQVSLEVFVPSNMAPDASGPGPKRNGSARKPPKNGFWQRVLVLKCPCTFAVQLTFFFFVCWFSALLLNRLERVNTPLPDLSL